MQHLVGEMGKGLRLETHFFVGKISKLRPKLPLVPVKMKTFHFGEIGAAGK